MRVGVVRVDRGYLGFGSDQSWGILSEPQLRPYALYHSSYAPPLDDPKRSVILLFGLALDGNE